jgi:dynein heavy chain, axonemal
LWTEIKEKFVYKPTAAFFSLVVPTKDTVRYSWMVEKAMRYKFPIFFTGMTGVGKSIIIQNALNKLKKTDDY